LGDGYEQLLGEKVAWAIYSFTAPESPARLLPPDAVLAKWETSEFADMAKRDRGGPPEFCRDLISKMAGWTEWGGNGGSILCRRSPPTRAST